MPQTRRPGHRAGLTRAAVLSAARDLLARGGVEALTMRALARALDVAPNALYSHVADKTELFDALLDGLLAEVAVPAPSLAPQRAVHEMLMSTYDVLTGAPELVPLYLVRQGARGANAVRLGVALDALLASAGVQLSEVASARLVLIMHAIGSAAFATGSTVTAFGGKNDTHPDLTPQRTRTAFDKSLGWLLAGLTSENI